MSQETVMSVKGLYEANSGGDAARALHQSLTRFSYDHEVPAPVLITSLRKAATHLVRNFGAHFVGRDRTFWPFVGERQLIKTSEIFAEQVGKKHWLYTGHVKRNWATNLLFRDAKVVLVVRDPYTQVISRAMHFFHESTTTPLAQHLRNTNAPLDEAIYYAIFGADHEGRHYPSVCDEYHSIAAAWFDRADVVLRHEDLVDQDIAPAMLERAARRLGWEGVPDSKERINASLSPDISASYWKKRRTIELSDRQKTAIDCLIPGIRAMFGYSC